MKQMLVLCSVLLMAACDGFSDIKVRDICEKHPTMCFDLNKDSWCRLEKSKIIKTRYALKNAPADKLKYDLLMGFEDYKKCITKASQIQHIKLKEKQTDRVKGLLTADREIARLSKETKTSKEPHLLYYHLSRYNDEKALKTFLSYRDRGLLETPELQVALASYYVKYNLDLAEQTLLHAAELLKPDSHINPEMVRGLISVYVEKEDFEKAYVWANVGRELELENIDLAAVEAVLAQNRSDLKTLRKIAGRYLDAMEDGEFSGRL